MIKSVTITNPSHESLTLDLFHPEYSGIYVKSIDGLGPVRANINVTDMATVDGGIFSSARQQTRNIVFNLGFLFEPTIEDVRLKTYKYFPIKKKIDLVFRTDRRVSEISGYVESNTPTIFSDNEDCQISIICTDPNFYAAGDTGTIFSGVKPLFEFPFPAERFESGSQNEIDMMEISELSFDTTAIFNYVGDADTGMTINLAAIGPVENITIWNNVTNEKMHIDTNKVYQITGIRFDNLDSIIIDTIRGQRSAKLLHEGKFYDILGAVDRSSDFFQLSNGTNVFSFVADNGQENLFVTLSYKNAYGGI